MDRNLTAVSSLILLGTISGCAPDIKHSGKDGGDNVRPNVLFILADDQRADALGCSGNSYIRTPNIDSLAENGVRFRNAYVMGGHHGNGKSFRGPMPEYGSGWHTL